tara:strand:+ start:4254 stop:5267 length:1014 start_codon:yes stop_codon:yes gene_type:complete
MTIISIPLSGVPKELRQQIEELLPEPQEVPGWKFAGYKWRKLTQINTKDSNGNTDNSVRIAGTGDNQTLEVSLAKGIDTSVLTPSIYGIDDLLNGFNRLKNLKQLGYKEWIFAQYEENDLTKTEFQDSLRERLQDARASMNKGFGQKVITVTEIEELGRERFEHREDREKDTIKRWIYTLDLNLSPQQVEGIAAKICKDFARRGIIDSYSRTEAQLFLDELGIGADLLNTYGINGEKADPTRALRTIYQVMKNYVDNVDTMNIALFDSQASSHEELEANRQRTIALLDEMDQLVLNYAAARVANLKVPPYNVFGAIPQATGKEHKDVVMQEKKLIEV